MSLKYKISKIWIVLGITQKHHSIYLSLAVFKYLSLIAFGNWMPSENKVQHASLKLFQLKNASMQPEGNFSGLFRQVHSILNVLKNGLTPLTLNSGKLANFREHPNGQSFLDLILNSMWLQWHIFKKAWHFKISNVCILRSYHVESYIVSCKDAQVINLD